MNTINFYNRHVCKEKYGNLLLLKDKGGRRHTNETKKVVEKIISKAAYNSAKANGNSNCTWFCYQPKTPEKLKNLEIFND